MLNPKFLQHFKVGSQVIIYNIKLHSLWIELEKNYIESTYLSIGKYDDCFYESKKQKMLAVRFDRFFYSWGLRPLLYLFETQPSKFFKYWMKIDLLYIYIYIYLHDTLLGPCECISSGRFKLISVWSKMLRDCLLLFAFSSRFRISK